MRVSGYVSLYWLAMSMLKQDRQKCSKGRGTIFPNVIDALDPHIEFAILRLLLVRAYFHFCLLCVHFVRQCSIEMDANVP